MVSTIIYVVMVVIITAIFLNDLSGTPLNSWYDRALCVLFGVFWPISWLYLLYLQWRDNKRADMRLIEAQKTLCTTVMLCTLEALKLITMGTWLAATDKNQRRYKK